MRYMFSINNKGSMLRSWNITHSFSPLSFFQMHKREREREINNYLFSRVEITKLIKLLFECNLNSIGFLAISGRTLGQ